MIRVNFEEHPVAGAGIGDLDLDAVKEYLQKIHSPEEDAEQYLRANGFITTLRGEDNVSAAAILLFGRHPQHFLPQAIIRFTKYQGSRPLIEEQVKSALFEGRLPDQLQETLWFVGTQIREYTRLGKDGRFHTTPEYPPLCWRALIVHAVMQRDYGIPGREIQVRMFDDHLEVEHPGRLPAVENPRIEKVLHAYADGDQMGGGMNRVLREMEEAGLPDPVFDQEDFLLMARLYNRKWAQQI